jgi:hypothetical protein
MSVGVALIAAVVAAAYLAGCGPVGELFRSERISGPRIVKESNVKRTLADGTVVEEKKRDEVQGSGYKGKNSENFKGSPSSLAADGSAIAGGARAKWFDLPADLSVYHIGGIALVLGGALAWYFLGWQIGAILIACGVAVMAIGLHPAIIYVPVLLGAAAAGYFVWQAIRGKSLEESKKTLEDSVKTIVAGVEKLPDQVKSQVTDSIGQTADKAGTALSTKEAVTQAKADLSRIT